MKNKVGHMTDSRLILSKSIRYVIIIGGAFIMLYPLLWMLNSSFKPTELIFKDLRLWPETFTLQNYIHGLKGVGGISFLTYFKNSFIIVILSTIGNLISCSMAAYAFSRLQFDLKKLFFVIMLVSIMMPTHVTLIPTYIIFFKLGWVDTFLPLIVPNFLATQAFFIFLMVQFIRGLPSELDKAATVDGCGPIQIYWRIIIPLLTPALVTTAIFSFIWNWNDFFSQIIYISNPKLYTVALGLRLFLDSMGSSSWGSMFAMSILSLVPIFIFFISFQKLLVEGIATSGIKG